MLTERRATCLCGACTALATGEPTLVAACACFECQRESGAAFGYNAYFPEGSVSLQGETDQYTHMFESGRSQTAHRCKTCGSPMWFTIEVMPGTIGLRVGTFTDPNFPKPGGFYYVIRKHHWLVLPEDIPLHDRA